MPEFLEERRFDCPYCWSPISMVLDLSAGSQSYVEDCEVCCRPIHVSYVAVGGRLEDFHAGATP